MFDDSPPPPPPPPAGESGERRIAPKLNGPPKTFEPPPRQDSFLDLIKNRQFTLKKKTEFTPLADKPIETQPKNVDELSIADLQVALKQVREQMQCSSSSSQSSESESTSSW